MLETLDYTFRTGGTPTILYFDLYLNTLICSALKISKLSEIILCPSRAPATYNSWLRHCRRNFGRGRKIQILKPRKLFSSNKQGNEILDLDLR